MVLKKSKFGGNTGNTLRKDNMGGYKICKTAGFISKQSEDTEIQYLRDDMPPPKEWLKNSIHSKKSTNSLNSSRNVKFSLNKNGKWLLPDQIKNEILAESQKEIAVDSKSKKCRKQKIRQRKARVAIVEKASEWGESRGYPSDKCFMNSVNECNNRKSKSWKGPINIPADVKDLMDITYTVETSIDSKSWPYHTAGHTPYWRSKEKNKCSHKFHGFEDEMYFDDYTYYDNDGEENDVVCTESYSPQEFGLDMYIKSNKAVKKQNHCDTSMLEFTIDTHFEKGSYIIIDRPQDLSEVEQIIESEIEETSEQTKEVFVDNVTSKEANCRVKTKVISSEYLTKRFGRSYVEGSCMPRQFIIFNNDFSTNGLVVCVRIFTEDLQLSSINLKIMNVSHDFLLCIDELMQHDIFDFEFFIDSCFPMDNVINISSSIREICPEESSIAKDFKPTAGVMAINDVCRGLFSTKHFNKSDYKNPSPAACPICYSIGAVTCMNECQHYACDVCWRMYLNTKISSAHYQCLCPETSCKQEVDPVTIITFLDCTLTNRYVQKYCELHVQKTPHLKFCPSANCSKVAVCQPASYASGKSVMSVIANIPSVNCDCLFRWCFECQHYDHWPASCLVNQSYRFQRDHDYNLLYDKHGNIIETEVHYRVCPKCGNPIDKNGGCSHMSCVCGFQFCWNCLKSYLNHDSLQCSLIKTSDILVTFSSLDLLSGSSKKIHMQRKAIQFGSYVRRVLNLKQKLKLSKLTCKFEYVDISNSPNSSVFTASKATTLLVTCYRLLENVLAANALCRSKHTSARILRFVNSVAFHLDLLHTSVNVEKLNDMKVGDVVKKIELVEASFKNISLLGIKKKSLKC